MKILTELRTILGWIKRSISELYYSMVNLEFIQINGINLHLGDHIFKTIKEVIYRGDYEGPESRFVRTFLENDDVVMEVGTGLGFLSTFCAKQIRENNVFTYEANPELKDIIQETYSINDVMLILENCLIGEHNGEHEFYLNKNF